MTGAAHPAGVWARVLHPDVEAAMAAAERTAAAALERGDAKALSDAYAIRRNARVAVLEVEIARAVAARDDHGRHVLERARAALRVQILRRELQLLDGRGAR